MLKEFAEGGIAYEDVRNKKLTFSSVEIDSLVFPFGNISMQILNMIRPSFEDGINLKKFCEEYSDLSEGHGVFCDYLVGNEKLICEIFNFLDSDLYASGKTSSDFRRMAKELWCSLVEKNQQTITVKDSYAYNELDEPILGRVFIFTGENSLINIFLCDLFYLIHKETPETPHKCSRCGQFYTSNKNTSKYCEDCGKERNKILNENRKKTPCRYLHKRILDKLGSASNYTGVDKNAFRIESNYYWAVVNGNEPKEIPKTFDSNIKTEQQYLEWLETIFKSPAKALRDKYESYEGE